MDRRMTLAAFAAALALWAVPARAAPPAVITYSGFLTETDGTPVTTASALVFRFYDAPTGGAALASETIVVVPLSDGYFTAVIGGMIADFAMLFDRPVYMSVELEANVEMEPRIPITSVPSALSVDWSGVVNRPVSECGGATPFVTGIDAGGTVTCAAAPPGGGACGAGQTLQWSGTAWACVTDQAGTVTSVGVAGPPLSVADGTTTPTISMTQAGAGASGWLSSTDWNRFDGKQQRVAGACAAGSSIRIINSDGTVTCQTDANSGGTVTSVTAGGGITVGGTPAAPTVAVSFAASGGNGGVATTVARGDHAHDGRYGVAGVQVLGFSDTVAVEGTALVEALTLPLGNPANAKVILNAHFTIERSASTYGYFWFMLSRTACGGVVVGAATSRSPPSTTETWIDEDLPITGFDPAAPANSTYVLCVRKFDNMAGSGTIYTRGMTASWAP